MTVFADEQIHRKAVEDADRVYKRHSAYKSMYIVKRYKELGGTYTAPKRNTAGKTAGKRRSYYEKKGVSRWIREEWIQVVPYVKEGKVVACGAANKKTKVCRPLIRVTEGTPITLPELLEMHGKDKVLKMARKKNRDMDGRIFWKTGKFYASTTPSTPKSSGAYRKS
jgi:hypothetical protein